MRHLYNLPPEFRYRRVKYPSWHYKRCYICQKLDWKFNEVYVYNAEEPNNTEKVCEKCIPVWLEIVDAANSLNDDDNNKNNQTSQQQSHTQIGSNHNFQRHNQYNQQQNLLPIIDENLAFDEYLHQRPSYGELFGDDQDQSESEQQSGDDRDSLNDFIVESNDDNAADNAGSESEEFLSTDESSEQSDSDESHDSSDGGDEREQQQEEFLSSRETQIRELGANFRVGHHEIYGLQQDSDNDNVLGEEQDDAEVVRNENIDGVAASQEAVNNSVQKEIIELKVKVQSLSSEVVRLNRVIQEQEQTNSARKRKQDSSNQYVKNEYPEIKDEYPEVKEEPDDSYCKKRRRK
eukprot:TRINITY_DN15679_c0_g1_i3.p1 TRINITY_DN15679_c0_g1~~TRINITY_DN15679_c0_g1_i3.p1  ORF type:complete len:348 (+),score=53.61 TRINITY_DN15679_c0_g1_i3:69-1112(+)